MDENQVSLEKNKQKRTRTIIWYYDKSIRWWDTLWQAVFSSQFTINKNYLIRIHLILIFFPFVSKSVASFSYRQVCVFLD